MIPLTDIYFLWDPSPFTHYCQYSNIADTHMLCYTLNKILEHCLEGASNIQKTTVHVDNSWAVQLEVGRCWGRGIPSLKGMHGCTVVPAAGCRAHLGASLVTAVAATWRKGEAWLREILPSYKIQWGMHPHAPHSQNCPSKQQFSKCVCMNT